MEEHHLRLTGFDLLERNPTRLWETSLTVWRHVRRRKGSPVRHPDQIVPRMKCVVLNSAIKVQGGVRVRVCAALGNSVPPRRSDSRIHKGDQHLLFPNKDSTKNVLLFEKVPQGAGNSRDVSHPLAGRLSFVPKGLQVFSLLRERLSRRTNLREHP